MATTVASFSDGGCVVHGLTLNQNFCKLRLSVWFDKEGRVTDCEGFDALNRPRPVPTKVRDRLGCEYGYVRALLRQKAAETATTEEKG